MVSSPVRMASLALMLLSSLPQCGAIEPIICDSRVSVFQVTSSTDGKAPAVDIAAYFSVLDQLSRSDITFQQFMSFRQRYTFNHEGLLQGGTSMRLLSPQKYASMQRYPIAELRNRVGFKELIQRLLNSMCEYNRSLGSISIALAGDTSFNGRLLSALKTEPVKGCRFFAGMALMYLNDNHTTELFDFIVRDEEFGDPHIIPVFLKLDKSWLKNAAYQRIDSTDPKARVLAVSVLSRTGADARTESALRKAIRDWPPQQCGYAISAMRELGGGGLKSILEPKLQVSMLRGVSLQALANSPSQEDRDVVFGLLPQEGTVPDDLAFALMRSNRIECVRKWLVLVREGRAVGRRMSNFERTMMEFGKGALGSAELTSDVIATINEIKDRPSNKADLLIMIEALAGRKDAASIATLKALSTASDPEIKSCATLTLSNWRKIEAH